MPGPVLLAVVITIATAFAVPRLVAEPVRVSSASMSPTFNTGDHVLVRKRLLGTIEAGPGDVVVFRRPDSAADAGGLLIKRVAAVAGDRVGLRDGHLVVNQHRVTEDYVVHAEVDGTYFGPVTVPADSVFVLGDNRADSIDSRDFGAVPLRWLVGDVLLRVWSGRQGG